MKFDEMADALDFFAEHLEVKFMHWILSSASECDTNTWMKKKEAIEEFIVWIQQENLRDLETKRGTTGISYVEGRRKYES
jgi:hypothetical protein